RNAKLAIYMPGRYLIIAAGHDVWVDADAYRVTAAKTVAKLLQDRNIVNVDANAQFNTLKNLFYIHAIGGEQYLLRRKTGHQAQLHLVYAHAVEQGAEFLYVL